MVRWLVLVCTGIRLQVLELFRIEALSFIKALNLANSIEIPQLGLFNNGPCQQ